MADQDIRAAFQRQRRFLVTISMVAFFTILTAHRLDRVVILGNEFTFENGVPEWPLWIVLVYALLRYLQYLHDLQDRGLVGAVEERLKMVLGSMAVRRRRAELKRDQLSKNPGAAFSYGPTKVEAQRNEFAPSVWTVDVAGGYSVTTSEGSVSTTDGVDYVFEGRNLFQAKFRAWAYVLTRTRLATEYGTPILLTLGAILWRLFAVVATSSDSGTGLFSNFP